MTVRTATEAQINTSEISFWGHKFSWKRTHREIGGDCLGTSNYLTFSLKSIKAIKWPLEELDS